MTKFNINLPQSLESCEWRCLSIFWHHAFFFTVHSREPDVGKKKNRMLILFVSVNCNNDRIHWMFSYAHIMYFGHIYYLLSILIPLSFFSYLLSSPQILLHFNVFFCFWGPIKIFTNLFIYVSVCKCVCVYIHGSPCLCVHEEARRRQEVSSFSICCSYESWSLLEPGNGVLATLEVCKPCQCFVQSLPPSLIGKGGECLACFVSARIWILSSMTVKQLSLAIESLPQPLISFSKIQIIHMGENTFVFLSPAYII